MKTLSRLLRQRLRRGDIVGRYGGEEFAVIFPDTNAETARKVLDQVRLAFVKIEQHANQQIFTATFQRASLIWNWRPMLRKLSRLLTMRCMWLNKRAELYRAGE